MTQTPDSFDNSIPVLTDVVVPGRPEYARAAAADVAALEYDASQAAEHVRERVTELLNNEARALIESRVEEVLRQHAPQLVQELTREVATALESRLKVWVGEAVEEELRRQREA
jgi:CRISPR/Cas system endoribonuclease Cas6 (RAMP superfamily)